MKVRKETIFRDRSGKRWVYWVYSDRRCYQLSEAEVERLARKKQAKVVDGNE